MHQSSKIHTGLGIALILLCCVVYWVVRDYPVSPVGVSPATFPRIAGGLLGLLGVVLIISELFPKTRSKEKYFTAFGREEVVIIMVICFTIAYIALVKRGGFLLTTTIYLLALLKVFGEKKTGKAILFAAALTFALFIIMRLVLRVPLPIAWLERTIFGY